MDNREIPRDVNSQPTPPNNSDMLPPNLLEPVLIPEKKKPTLNNNSIKNFFSITFASLLYCLSAASIMYAIMKLIGPALENSYQIRQTLPSVFVLTLYELALLAVLMFILIKARAVNDAIQLVILMAFFSIGTGLALSTISLTAPDICLFIGINCVLIGIIKIYVLKKYIKLRIDFLTFIGLAMILIWNFIASSLMARLYVTNDCTDEVRRFQWIASWIVLLIGAGLIVISAITKSSAQYQNEKQNTPFLNTHSMIWLYSLVILAAACYHQYATGYMFHVDTASSDYLLLITLVVLLFVELLRSTTKKQGPLELAILCLPGAVIFYYIITDQLADLPLSNIISAPILIFSVMLIATSAMAYLHKFTKLYCISIVYALCILLTVGYRHGDIFDLNWELFSYGLSIIMMAVGIVKKEPLACFASVMVLAYNLTFFGRADNIAQTLQLSELGLFAAIAGFGNLVVALVFGKKTHKTITVISSICIAAAAYDAMPPKLNPIDIVIMAILILCAAALWFSPKNIIALPILFIPLVPRGILMWQQMSIWAFVILSFTLLFAGGAISFLTSKKNNSE